MSTEYGLYLDLVYKVVSGIGGVSEICSHLIA